MQLQSTRGTSLETLLLAEGLPAIPQMNVEPSTSTGTFTEFGRSMRVLGISDHDSGRDGTLTKRTSFTVSGLRDSLQEIRAVQREVDERSTTLLEMVPDQRQGDQMSTSLPEVTTSGPEVGPNRKQGDRMSTFLPEVTPSGPEAGRPDVNSDLTGSYSIRTGSGSQPEADRPDVNRGVTDQTGSDSEPEGGRPDVNANLTGCGYKPEES